ncbi:uncharacterized protein LOC114530263 [Dendronephthya gigantea]|uniref:uncharacterized protein LOC114530263 n=1 Tax=Dendronephthya gigantea TaxID=151771 RepID=UPI00106A95ED|nr:uncharacterized protein LOC114530263 [Dendronephthya gigantea]
MACYSSSKAKGLSLVPLIVHFQITVLYILSSTKKVESCNNSTLGSSSCIRISRYSGEQWSTCVTDLYIRQKSKGRHGCLKGQQICIYQCMLEVYSTNSGAVSKPCTCSTGEILKTDDGFLSVTFKPSIPAWCSSPTGANCGWFKTCLAQRFPCAGKFKNEVIKFGEVLCKSYLNPYSHLSRNAHMWLNGVRKCLQVNLVPLLRIWQGTRRQNSCKALTRRAISLYRHCFFSPYPATITTICKLPLVDLWRIFWHLRQTLTDQNVQNSLMEILKTIERCDEFRKVNLNLGKVRKFLFQVNLGTLKKRTLIAKELSIKIAKHLCLDRKGISWFAYSNITQKSENSTIELVFYIADEYEHRMRQKFGADTLVNLNDTVKALTEAVRKNELCFQVFDGEHKYRITATTVCNDIECQSNSWKVVASELSPRKSSVPMVNNCRPVTEPSSMLLLVAEFILAMAVIATTLMTK